MKENLKTVGYASWTDPSQWMEKMKGSRWNSLVAQSIREYNAAIKDLGDLPHTIAEELEQRETSIPPMKLYETYYQQSGKQTFAWWHSKQKKTYVTDLDLQPDQWVWYVQDTKDGDESYSLHCCHEGQHKWSYSKRSLGPFVAVVNNRVYCLESENHLWFCRLISLDAHTGNDRQVLYEETNPQWNLALIKGEHHCLFLLANNAGKQRLWYLNRQEVLEEITGYESFVPVGFAKDSQTVHYFGRKEGESFYTFSGLGSLQCLQTQTPEFACLTEEILVTKHYGKRTLWNLRTGKALDIMVGQFQPDLLTPWILGKARFATSRPGYAMALYEPDVDCLCGYARSSYRMTKSKDRTSVPYILVQSRDQKPQNLLVVGYGAYGMTTHLNVDRWKPLLRRGWAICLALVRGGGDHTDEWAEAARTLSKGKSIEDFEACIRAAQKTLRIWAAQTALYGRSAGGYLVGSTLSRNPQGRLFGCVYLEVPYLDVLATTSNPSLPLTQMEYNEFGDPLHRPQNFQALLDLSPIDTIPESGAPSIFVLCRTGLHDKEVFAYESFKWITKLKEAQGSQGQPKLLAVARHQGHFPSGTSATQNRSSDLALLVNWGLRISKQRHLQKKSPFGIYEMANTRRNRKNRKNTRKNRKNNNMTMRKNNNSMNMMGGKRRRRNMTRRRR
jgi:protease II